MADDGLAIAVILLMIGFVLNVASPHLSPYLDANLGLWGAFFALIGLITFAIRLRAMSSR